MNFLVIPDIHGRNFWKDVTNDISKYDKVIFLGDYVDPYDFEKIDADHALNNFIEIIEFANSNKDKVILLLGNHDIPYFFNKTGVCRYSYKNAEKLNNIFLENKHLFKIAYETKKTIFTHAGILKEWINDINEMYKNTLNINSTSESLNSLIDISNNLKEKYNCLNFVSFYRGGIHDTGSCLWADKSEHLNLDNRINKFQVFGHSLQIYYNYYTDECKDGLPIIDIKNNYAMLDCRHAFNYNEEIKSFEQL